MVDNSTLGTTTLADPGSQELFEPFLLRAAQAAARCNMSLRSWRARDATGSIPRAIRIGRSTFWRPEELKAWVAAGCPDRVTWEALQE